MNRRTISRLVMVALAGTVAAFAADSPRDLAAACATAKA